MRGAGIFLFTFCLIIGLSGQTQQQTEGAIEDTTYRYIYKVINEGETGKAQSLLDSLKRSNTGKRAEFKALLLQSELLRKEGNYQQAATLLQTIDTSKITSPGDFSEYYYQQSKATSKPKIAKDFILKGINKKKKSKNPGMIDLPHYYNSAGAYSQRLGQIDSAVFYYNKAINTALENEHGHTQKKNIALFYQNLALPYAIRRDFDQAKKHLYQSIEILEQSSARNNQDLARNYNNLGRIHFMTGIMDSAEYYYSKAEQIRVKVLKDNDNALAILYLNMGAFYAIIPNLEKAQSYFREAKYIYEKAGMTNSENYIKANLNLGFNLLKQRNYEEAAALFKEVVKSDFPVTNATAYRHLAICYTELGNRANADEFFNKSIKILEEAKKSNQYELALSYISYGSFLLSSNKIDKGLSLLFKAKDILESLFGPYNRDVALAYIEIARHQLLKEDFSKALKYSHTALQTLVKAFETPDPTQYPDEENLAVDNYLTDAIFLKGRIFLERYNADNNLQDLLEARKAYKKGLEIVESIRTDYEYESNKLLIAERSESDYNSMLEVLLQLYNHTGKRAYLEEIYKYMEKSKAAVLLSSITESNARITANIPDTVLNKEKYLRSRLNGLKKLVYDEKQKSKNQDQEKINEWENAIFRIKQEYHDITKYIKTNYNDYYKLRLNPEILTLQQTTKQLKSNQAIVEYSFLSDKTLALLIMKDHQELFITDASEEEITALIEQIRSDLTVEDLANFDTRNFHSFTKTTHQLYNHLLKSMEQQIEDKKLIIIPDGKLGFIPLEVLLTEKIDPRAKMNFKNLPYLFKKHPLSYAYSSTLLLSDNKRKAPSRKKVFYMAPSYDNITRMPIDSIFVKRQQSTILMPIPGAKEEVQNIRNIFNSDVWLDKKATENNFKENASDYAILHLAMHTILDDTNPMYSKLVFYQEEERNGNNDNLLNTYELFDLTLNAELAVLSACNTGYGKLQRGEGIMSLARGFLYAGVPSIVMTLWPIEDAATAEIMKYFYQNLSEGMKKDIALRQAKLKFLDSTDMLTSHPHFWASFVSIGPDTAINHTRQSNNTIWWIISAAAAIALSFATVKIIKRRR